jgi:hypothetical protein
MPVSEEILNQIKRKTGNKKRKTNSTNPSNPLQRLNKEEKENG